MVYEGADLVVGDEGVYHAQDDLLLGILGRLGLHGELLLLFYRPIHQHNIALF